MRKALYTLWAVPVLALAGFGIPQTAHATPSICDAVSGNFITNCGFEGGTYTSTISANTNTLVPDGWTPNAGFDLEGGFNRQIAFANSGSFGLSIGNFDDQAVPALSQSFADLSGGSYSGSIFVYYGGGTGGDAGAFFDVQIDGSNVLALDDTNATNAWAEYTFDFSGTGSDTLTLTGNTNPSEWFVDDVVVTGPAAVASVPEPASMALLGTGLVGLWAARRRRRKA